MEDVTVHWEAPTAAAAASLRTGKHLSNTLIQYQLHPSDLRAIQPQGMRNMSHISVYSWLTKSRLNPSAESESPKASCGTPCKRHIDLSRNTAAPQKILLAAAAVDILASGCHVTTSSVRLLTQFGCCQCSDDPANAAFGAGTDILPPQQLKKQPAYKRRAL
jgi:hypothetical protein